MSLLQIAELEGKIERRDARIAELEATLADQKDGPDAKRYRYLFACKNFCRNPLWPVVDWFRDSADDPTKEEIDASLDAGMLIDSQESDSVQLTYAQQSHPKAKL